MAPAAKKVLEEASKPNRRKGYVTAQQVLAQILTLQLPDPAAVLLALSAWTRQRFAADWMRSHRQLSPSDLHLMHGFATKCA